MAKQKRLIDIQPGTLIGVDENGLGARLGPLVVTGVRAQVSADGLAFLRRGLGKRIRRDLDDSKVLVSNKDYRVGEAWARALIERAVKTKPETPGRLFELLSLDKQRERDRHCPDPALAQCGFQEREGFVADDETIERIKGHLDSLASRGVELTGVRSYRICTGELNRLKRSGVNRFAADLHGMEKVVMNLSGGREDAPPLTATCGKVGGMAQYGRFFGPLSGRLHAVLHETQAESAYSFPGLGIISFLRDADASDPLVMMASLVGKYVRELLMSRIARFYIEGDSELPSGYHDPVTGIFVAQTLPLRRSLSIVDACFERERDSKEAREDEAPPKKKKATSGPAARASQSNLFD